MRTFMKVWLIISLVALGIGIGLTAVVSVAATVGRGEYGLYSINETYDNVESIDIRVGFGKVEIIEGEDFSIDARSLINDDFESYVDNGTWVINDKSDTGIFGFNISYDNIILNHDFVQDITITVPKDFIAKELFVKTSAGQVKIDTVQADTAVFTMNAGYIEIDNIKIYDKAEISVDVGDINVKKIEANDIDVECSIGTVNLRGNINGTNNIRCDIGKIFLDLEGDEDEYIFDIDKDIVNVIINNRRYHRIKKRNNQIGARADFILECNIGNITIVTN